MSDIFDEMTTETPNITGKDLIIESCRDSLEFFNGKLERLNKGSMLTYELVNTYKDLERYTEYVNLIEEKNYERLGELNKCPYSFSEKLRNFITDRSCNYACVECWKFYCEFEV